MKLLNNIHPLVLLLAMVLILFSPILFSTKLLPGFDPLLLFYPYSYQYLNQQSFWTKNIFSGFDTWALPAGWAGNWLYYFLMPQAVVNFLDFITFYHVIIFFYVILALTFAYLAARQMDFDKWIATLVASTYIFSAYNLSWMVNSGTGASLFIFPSLIYFLLKFGEKFNWFWPIFGGIFLGLGLVMSHLQYALIAIFGGFLFALFLTFKNGIRLPMWIFLAAIAVIFLIGLGLSIFELVPEYQLTQLTPRGQGLSFSQSQECALGTLDFVRYLMPNFNFRISCESLLYIGVLPLILAILAIFYFPDRKKILFWVLLLAFAVLFSVKYSPLARVFHYLPVWGSLRGPSRFIMLANFSLAVLAGFGFNWILENKNNFPVVSKVELKELKIFKWIKGLFFIFLSLIVAINVLGLFKTFFVKLAQNYFDKYYYQKTIGLPIEHYHRVIENLINSNFYTFSLSNKDFVIPLILTVTAFLTVIFVYKFNQKTLFYVFLFSGFIWAATSPMVSSGFTRDFFKETEVIWFLKEQMGIFRIYSLMPNLATYQLVATIPGANQTDEAEFFKTMLPPNLNIIYDIDSIDGLETSIPKRTGGLLAEILSERTTSGNKIADSRLKPEEKIKIFESRANILSMMNVKYIISAFPLDVRIFKKVFETKATRFSVPVYIYENRNVLPRFYFANNIRFIKDDEFQALDAILKPDIDFGAVAFIECEEIKTCGQRPETRSKIIDFEYRDGYLKLNTETDSSAWLVFSESFNPFWRVQINGQNVPIYKTNYIYQAVIVPAGKNIIEFKYLP